MLRATGIGGGAGAAPVESAAPASAVGGTTPGTWYAFAAAAKSGWRSSSRGSVVAGGFGGAHVESRATIGVIEPALASRLTSPQPAATMMKASAHTTGARDAKRRIT